MYCKGEREWSHWDENYPVHELGHGKSVLLVWDLPCRDLCISGLDVGSAALKLNDEGFYIMRIAAADMGTGCDTILAQIAAEVLECPLDKVIVFGADTDASPYDSGSCRIQYDLCNRKATEAVLRKLRDKICLVRAKMLGCDEER